MPRLAPGKLARLAGIGIGLAVASQFLIVQFAATRQGPDRHSDFVDYYVAAQLLRSGQSPYDPVAQLQARSAAIGAQPDPGAIVYYFYPPPFLLLIVPFTLLSVWAANAVWTGFQVCILWGGCACLLGRALRGWSRPFVLIWSLAWLPVVVSFKFGQISLLLLLAFLGFARALEHRNDLAAGFWTVVLGLKPTLLLLPVMLLLYLRSWRALFAAAVLSTVAVATTAVAFGSTAFAGYRDAVHLAADLQASSALWRVSSYSLAALTRGLGSFDWPVLIVLSVLVVGLWLQIFRKHGATEAAIAMPVAAVLISPHVFIYDFAICLATAPALVRRRPLWRVLFLLSGFVLPWVAHVALSDPRPVIFWMLLLLGLLVWTGPQRTSVTPRAQSQTGSEREIMDAEHMRYKNVRQHQVAAV